MKSILYLLPCFVLLQCCDQEKDTYNNLPQDKLYIFKIGDTLLYACTKTQMQDTIIVGTIKFDYSQSEHIYNQYQIINFESKTGYIYDFLSGVDFANITWKDLNEYISFSWDHTSFHVVNKDINDVYIVSNSNKPNTIITKQVYFSPSYGFVRVIYANNDTFDLYKVIPH